MSPVARFGVRDGPIQAIDPAAVDTPQVRAQRLLKGGGTSVGELGGVGREPVCVWFFQKFKFPALTLARHSD